MRASSSRASATAAVLFIAASVGTSLGFTISHSNSGIRGRGTTLYAGDQEEDTTKQDKNAFELASWYAVEAFGRAFGSKKTGGGLESADSGDIDFIRQPLSLDETLQRIQLDNDRSYFLSGEVDELIYDEKCTFADPFVSFDGRQRFVDNLANLGSFISDYSARPLSYSVTGMYAHAWSRLGMHRLKLSQLHYSCRERATNPDESHGETRVESSLETSAGMAMGCQIHC